MSDDNLLRALSNTQCALQKLEEFIATEAETEREMAGVIQAFEFTFELFWKMLQKVAAIQGIDAPSPKRALAAGYQLGLCSSEKIWLQMLSDRNSTSHTYKAAIAATIYLRIRDTYVAAFRLAHREISAEIASSR
jgi:nucleotidyltransferase substrate binding protein (TIGR01987 family)